MKTLDHHAARMRRRNAETFRRAGGALRGWAKRRGQPVPRVRVRCALCGWRGVRRADRWWMRNCPRGHDAVEVTGG